MSGARTQAAGADPVATATTRVVARWRVSRLALDRVLPGVVAPGKAHQHALLEIVLEGPGAEGGREWSSSATLIDPRLKTTHRLDASAPEVRVTREGEHTHVEAPGLLSATFAGPGHAPLFVRTPLLASLGVPGGRYELDAASIDETR